MYSQKMYYTVQCAAVQSPVSSGWIKIGKFVLHTVYVKVGLRSPYDNLVEVGHYLHRIEINMDID
jgi:hypothetical protein